MIKKNIINKLDFYYFKKLLILNQNKKLLGKNKIAFRKNNFIFSKLNKIELYIYKGNKFRNILINIFHYKQRLGFFCLTRKPFKYIIKTKSNSKNLKR